MSGALQGYQTVLTVPWDNYFGLIFARRLPVEKAVVVSPTQDQTLSVLAELRTSWWQLFHFMDRHLQPPVPSMDTEEPDLRVFCAARFAPNRRAAFDSGSFNDAA